MTPSPHTIAAEQSLTIAHRLMRAYDIRHLPVLREAEVVGILTQRDLHLIETLRDAEPDQVRADEAMSEDPYLVTRDTPLAEVVRTMAERKLGSAMIMDGSHVVGIFTVVDALRVFAELLTPLEPGA